MPSIRWDWRRASSALSLAVTSWKVVAPWTTRPSASRIGAECAFRDQRRDRALQGHQFNPILLSQVPTARQHRADRPFAGVHPFAKIALDAPVRRRSGRPPLPGCYRTIRQAIHLCTKHNNNLVQLIVSHLQTRVKCLRKIIFEEQRCVCQRGKLYHRGLITAYNWT